MTSVVEPPCEVVADEVQRRFEETRAGLAVYWVAVGSDRGGYAQRLRSALREHPIGVTVLRRGGLFENANSVMADVATLIDVARETLEAAFSAHPSSRRWGMVVISRTPMSLGQSSSPVELPEWFPDLGGMEVHSSIEDVSWLGHVELNHPDLSLPALHRRLYDLEGALLRRLRYVNDTSPRAQSRLFAAISRPKDADLREVLSAAASEWRQVPNPDGYRPSAKHDQSVIARIWSKTAVTKPRFMQSDIADPLAAALKLDPALLSDVNVPSSLFWVLARPGQGPSPTEGQRFAENLVWTVATAFRLLTASHHTDGYGRFAYPLLFSVSLELRGTLAAYEQALNLHE